MDNEIIFVTHNTGKIKSAFRIDELNGFPRAFVNFSLVL